MSILDDIERESAKNPHVHIDFCKAQRSAKNAGISDDDFTAVVSSIRLKKISVRAGHEILHKHGAQVSYSTFERHVKKMCACPEDGTAA